MNNERILIVDDDDALLNLMGLSLKRRGYQVELAENGPKALTILKGQPSFSVMVTDMVMPGMSGSELLREARQIDPFIECIVVTAIPDLDAAISAMRADGAYDYLLKPFESMNQMVLVVERAISHRDLILERVELQRTIQHEAERLHALISHTSEAVLSANSNGILQVVNPAASRLFGKDDLKGAQALNSLPPILANLIENWQAVGGNRPAVVEIAWPDETVQMVSLSAVPEDGVAHWGWVAVLRDITHIRKMDEMKSQLLIDVANRVRPPLSQALNTLVELNALAAQNNEVGEVVSRLSNTWKRIQEWSDDLNALMHIDSEFSPKPTSVNLESILNEIQRIYCAQFLRCSEIQLDVAVEANLPQVIADPELIQRLIYSLLNRAVHRSPDGGVIHLTARHHNQQVWVIIGDDGPSVAETDLPHIFDISFVKTTPGSTVTGLEMALVKTFIDRMGGQIWIGGQDDQDNAVIVCLPVS